MPDLIQHAALGGMPAFAGMMQSANR